MSKKLQKVSKTATSSPKGLLSKQILRKFKERQDILLRDNAKPNNNTSKIEKEGKSPSVEKVSLNANYALQKKKNKSLNTKEFKCINSDYLINKKLQAFTDRKEKSTNVKNYKDISNFIDSKLKKKIKVDKSKELQQQDLLNMEEELKHNNSLEYLLDKSNTSITTVKELNYYKNESEKLGKYVFQCIYYYLIA